MKKTLSIALAVMMLAICLVACGGGGAADSPEAAVKNFMNAINSNNNDALIACVAPEYQKDLKDAFDQLKSMGMNMSIKDILEMSGMSINFSNAIIGEVTVDGDNATVETTINVDGDANTSKIPCIKVDGKWYVDMNGAF